MSLPDADPLTIYCPACNEAFLGRLADSTCPRCGMKVSESEQVSLETIVASAVEEERSGEIHSSTRHIEDALESLIGQPFDRYHIESFLGQGGMGRVFLARHLHLNRPCALKILSPRLVQRDPDYLERFQVEGQAAASLNHPNIVTIHAIGEHNALHFLEMEFVPARSLQKVILDQPLLPIRALTLGVGIAEGLAAAHRVGIVHRDLKPDNVLMSHHGVPKISDFGLAKRIHGQSARDLSGTIAGTPHFMAPELFHGESATPASDIYALGVTLFFMLTGRLPFTRPKINELISAVTHEPPPSLRSFLPDLPLEICECVSQMLEKCPANRPRDGIAASQYLQAILGGIRDLESLMTEAFAHAPSVRWHREGKQYCASVLLPNGRRQSVCVETSSHAMTDRLLQIYSKCCPAQPDYYAEALRLNSSLAHGAIAIREIDGQDFFVTVSAYPRGTVDAEEIRRSVLELAQEADKVEHALTGEDKH